MTQVPDDFAIRGPGRFQWQAGGWFGSILGGSAWLIPTAVLLAMNHQSRLAVLPAACFALMVGLGTFLWFRRDRTPPFPALIGVLAVFSIVTPLVWFSVATYATPQSRAALNWPQQGLTGTLAALICPAIIAWLFVLEYSGRYPKPGSPGTDDRG